MELKYVKTKLKKVRDNLTGDPRLRKLKGELFVVQSDPGKTKKIFSGFVKMVEVEVHSYCNRICWFCPNSFIDRKTKTYYLDENVYLKLLKDLANIKYSNIISFSRYCEPFADPIFYLRLEQARKYLPKAKLHTNTNGDYLNNGVVKRVYGLGLRNLGIQLYLMDRNAEFSYQAVERLAEKQKQRIPIVDFHLFSKEDAWIEYRGKYKNMDIRMQAADFKIKGVNRGGLNVVEDSLRYSPCLQPFFRLYIDYNGNVVPCCNIRSDNPQESNYALGNITKDSIFQIFTNNEMVKWRKNLIHFSPKQRVCKNCTFELVNDTLVNRYLSKNNYG